MIGVHSSPQSRIYASLHQRVHVLVRNTDIFINLIDRFVILMIIFYFAVLLLFTQLFVTQASIHKHTGTYVYYIRNHRELWKKRAFSCSQFCYMKKIMYKVFYWFESQFECMYWAYERTIIVQQKRIYLYR